MRSPRDLLFALAVVTAGSAMALGWLAWETLRRDDAVEAQREQERLAHDVDLVVQALERRLGDVEERLAESLATTALARDLALDPGVGLVLTPSASRAISRARLVFYPSSVVAARPEPQPALFSEGEAAEYRDRDNRRASEIYRRLAQSSDPAVRAAALMRFARTLRATGDVAAALPVYADMASLSDVLVIGLPSELVARDAMVEILRQLGRTDEAERRAGLLLKDLADGRWVLTQGQFEHFAESAARAAAVTAPVADQLAAARVVSEIFREWQSRPTPRGRRVFRSDTRPVVAVWLSSPERLAVWVVDPEVLAKGAAGDSSLAVTFSDADGVMTTSSLASPDARFTVVRAPAETRLPWTVHAARVQFTPVTAGMTRGRLVVAGLAVMFVFLVAGAYAIGRVVKREVDLAHLQSDFVSAVSHEFRTPLAAMRQLSELLAAGRVPHEARRQHYYESLAGESRRLQRLVENLLNFGRLQADSKPYKLESIDPATLVDEVVQEFRSQLSQPDCRIEVSGSADPIRMLGDRDAVALALQNLIDNAVKYSGGREPVRIEWARLGDRIALSVRDRGPGIAAGEERRIFEKFVRGTAAAGTKVRGTGVGLAMVQSVAVGHGGEVVVESQPGAGATFTLLLPAVPS